jgi:hypothetical protein
MVRFDHRLSSPMAERHSFLSVTVLILGGGVLGIAGYFASQFLPHTRCQRSRNCLDACTQRIDRPFFQIVAYTVYSLVAPSVTIVLLIML